MIEKLAENLVKHRFLWLGIILLVTLFFLWHMRNIQVESRFGDLLPQNHPYIKVHNQYKDQLGDPLKVFLMLQVKDGTIYTKETLQKVKRITDALDAITGVNHNQIYSIASQKIKKITVTSYGIISENFMEEVPETEQEMAAFAETVRNTSSVYGIWVSPNEKAVLFTAAFIGELVDYQNLFDAVKQIQQKESDGNHILYAAGEPVLTGWVYHYSQEMYLIFVVSIVALIGLLIFYFRNFIGVIVPAAALVLDCIWGLGFCGLMGFNLEPLTLVIPLLISARALSHSVQMSERYFECYQEHGEKRRALVACTASIMPPGILGVMADTVGVLLIAVAPIPMMQKLAYICAFWSVAIIPSVLLFTPLLISFFPPPKNVAKILDQEKGMTQKILSAISHLGHGKAAAAVVCIGAVIFAYTIWVSLSVQIGDVNPGTPILWQDSEYNRAIAQVNQNFPGTDEMYVIVEGKQEKAIADPDFINALDLFQRHMERHKEVASTLSLADLLMPVSRAVNGGHPKWEIFQNDRNQLYQTYSILTGNAAPGDYDRFASRDEGDANVIVWFKDHMGDTIRTATASAQEFIDANKEILDKEGITFRLASGNIGMLASINETVLDSQLLNFVLVLLSVFLLCSFTYRSFVAAIILMLPLNLANFVTTAIMQWMGIGLNINTLPIVAVGVGVGIDYGIYLLSRICEEYQRAGVYSHALARSALKTTGKAIFFTATTMISATIVWYFLSSLRFQAEMGLLLAIIMFINMIGALIFIPALVSVIKPKFLGSSKILIQG